LIDDNEYEKDDIRNYLNDLIYVVTYEGIIENNIKKLIFDDIKKIINENIDSTQMLEFEVILMEWNSSSFKFKLIEKEPNFEL